MKSSLNHLLVILLEMLLDVWPFLVAAFADSCSRLSRRVCMVRYTSSGKSSRFCTYWFSEKKCIDRTRFLPSNDKVS